MTITATATARPRLATVVSALVQAAVLVTGLPILLVRAVGWPLPHKVPQWTDIQRAYQLRYLPDRFVIGALACAGWICWLMIVASLVHGGIAHVRATNYRRPRLVLPGIHGLVGRWISAATLTVVLFSRPAGASTTPARNAVAQNSRTVDTTSASPIRGTVPAVTVVRPDVSSAARTIVTGEHQTYWDIAESTLGDGHRWREILDANPNLGHVDLVPAGITINIPDTTTTAPMISTHIVEKGDNLWNIAATELADAHHGDHPRNAEIVPYWRAVIDVNDQDLRSGDPNLIYPGENIELPHVTGDERTTEVGGVTQPEENRAASAIDEATTPSLPTTAVNPISVTATTVPTTAEPGSNEVVDDVDTDFEIPWLQGLAITGIAAAGILAAWHAQRRRRIRAHKPGDPIPVLAEPDRELISQLRAIAADRHHEAVDTAFRYLATTVADDGQMPSISVARAGRHSVELLLDDPQTPTPNGFLRLDQQTIVINPGTPDEEIANAIKDRQPPAPTLVAIGSDDIGTVLIDLERTRALAIEAATDAEATSVAIAMLTELATQPWAAGTIVLAYGVPATVDPDERIVHFDDLDQLINRAEEHIQDQTDNVVANGTHTVRSRGNGVLNPMVVVLGPGQNDTARVLAAAACQPGSALAIVCCDAIPNSAWRLVTTNGRTTLEPTGLTVAVRHLRPSTLDEQANTRLTETFGEPTPEPTAPDHKVTVDEVDTQGSEPVTAVQELLNDPVEEDQLGVDSVDLEPGAFVVETGATNIDPVDAVSNKDLPAPKGFDQLILIDEPPGDAPPANLSVAEKINHVMRRRPVEVILLDGPPRMEGVTWNGKDAARADEIVTFLALNGPSTLSQVATALWPDKVRPGETAKQLISRARKTLGSTADGHQRISPSSRSAAYRLVDVGCDWHRFEQLCCLAETEDAENRSRLLRTALTLVRTPPFDVSRPGAFHWAADQCFDSRMRLKISEATRRFEADANEPDGEWAREIRLSVTRAV